MIIGVDETGGEGELRLRLLGGFQVSAGSRIVGDDDWKLRKAKILVKLLALTPGYRLHREQAMEAIWPDLDPRAASNNLRKAIHFARYALDPSLPQLYLQAKDDWLILIAPHALSVDIETFRRTASAAHRTADLPAYSQAIALYAGELLPEDPYEDWAIGPREELRNSYLHLLYEAAKLQETAGDRQSAIETLGKAVEVEPLNEEAHTGLMRLYALSGETVQALRQYRRFSERLRQELDIEPGDKARFLYEEIKEGRY